MKKIILSLITISLFACGSDENAINENNENNTVIADFLNQVESFEAIEEKAPVTYFEGLASEAADDIMDLSKDNINDVLEVAKGYSKCVIIVEDHTIVRIDDVTDCKQSGSWGACMPMAKGYIKRGDLEYQEDFINNIIGTPDSKERTAFLFK